MEPKELRDRHKRRIQQRYNQSRESLQDTPTVDGELLSSAGVDTEAQVRRLQPNGVVFNDGRDRVEANPFVPFLAKVDFFPWIGSGSKFDLFSLKPVSVLPNGIAYADAFLWADPDEVEGNQIQPWYGSYKNAGSLTFESYLPKLGTRTTIKSASVDAASYYHGGTCFYDPAGIRVVSAFEDSSVVDPWPGARTSIEVNGEILAHPVGAFCYGSVEQASESYTFGSNVPNPVDDVSGYSFYSSSLDVEETANPIYGCRFVLGFSNYFQQITDYLEEIKQVTLPVLTGENITVFSKIYETGIRERTDNFQFTGPDFGHPNVVLNRPSGVTPVMRAGQQTEGITVNTTNVGGLWDLPNWHLSASDGFQYSNEYFIYAQPARNYIWALVSGLPASVGQTVTLSVTNGGDSGLEFKTKTVVDNSAIERLNVYPIETAEALAGSVSSTFTQLSAFPGKAGFDMVVSNPNNVGSIPPTYCTNPNQHQDWNDPYTDEILLKYYDFVIEDSVIPARTTYSYEANPRLTEIQFANSKWVLVAQSTGKRYFLSYQSSTFDFAEAPDLTENTEETATTLNVNGAQFTFSLTQEPEEIVWDSFAGDIADLSVGQIILYPSNSLEQGHLAPEFSQVLPNNYTFNFTQGSGGAN